MTKLAQENKEKAKKISILIIVISILYVTYFRASASSKNRFLPKFTRWIRVQKGSGLIIPPNRMVHQKCFMSDSSNKLMVFGGQPNPTTINSSPSPTSALFIYNFEKNKFSKIIMEEFPKLFGHEMVKVSDEKIYIFGGKSSLTDFNNNVYVFNSKNFQMTKILTKKGNEKYAPKNLFGHCGFYYKSKIYLKGRDKELYIWNVAKDEWKAPVTIQDFPRMSGHSCNVYNDRVYVYGKAKKTKDLLFYMSMSNLRVKHLDVSMNNKRSFHTAVRKDNLLFVYGGVLSKNDENRTAIFNLNNHKWIKFLESSHNEIPLLNKHCSVISPLDKSVVVFGGSDNFFSLDEKYQKIVISADVDTEDKDIKSQSSKVDSVLNKFEILAKAVSIGKKNTTLIEKYLKKKNRKQGELLNSKVEEKIKLMKSIERLQRKIEKTKRKQDSLRFSLSSYFVLFNEVKKLVNGKNRLLKKNSKMLRARLPSLRVIEVKNSLGDDILKQVKKDIKNRETDLINLRKESLEENDLNKEATSQAEIFENTLKSLSEKKNKIDTDFSAIETNLEQLKSKKELSSKYVENYTKNRKELEKQVEDLQNQISKHERSLALLEEKIKNREQSKKDAENLKLKLSKVWESYQKIQKEKTEIFGEQESGKKDFVSDQDLQKLEKSIEQFNEQQAIKKNKLTKKISSLQKDLKFYRARLVNNNINIKEEENNIKRYIDQEEFNKNRSSELAQAKNECEKKHSLFESKVEKKKSSAKKSNLRLENLQTQIRVKTKLINSVKQEHKAKLEALLQTAKKNIITTEQLSELKGDIDNFEQLVDVLLNTKSVILHWIKNYNLQDAKLVRTKRKLRKLLKKF